MTSESSGPIKYLLWGLGGLGSLDLGRPLLKLNSSSEIIDKDMEPRKGYRPEDIGLA